MKLASEGGRGGVEVEEHDGADEGCGEDHHSGCQQSAPGFEQEQQSGPEKVELFFDAERPGVIEGPGALLVIVHGVGESVEDVAGLERNQAEAGQDHDYAGVEVEGRENTDRTPGVKVFDRDGSVTAIFFEQKGSDQEAGDQEKNSDAIVPEMSDKRIEPGVGDGVDGMSDDDKKDAQGAKAIERWNSRREYRHGDDGGTGRKIPGGIGHRLRNDCN